MSASVIALYFWNYFDVPVKAGSSFSIDMISLYLASTTAFISFVSYLWIPKKIVFPASLAVYLLLGATTASLVYSTGGLSSLFMPLWVLVVIFTGVFGFWGTIPLLATVGAFVYYLYVNHHIYANNLIDVKPIIIIALTTIVPLIGSSIIWHKKSEKDKQESGDREYKDLANELSEITSKSEVVINAIGDGVMAIDGQGIIRLINPAAQRLIGWGKQDAMALNYKSVFKLVNQKGEPLDEINDPIQHVMSVNQQMRTNDFTVVTKGEKRLAVSLVVSPVSNEPGSGVIAVFHDITKEKAEERGQAEFISTASHEMRTPVAAIEGYLALALNPQTSNIDEKARSFILKAHGAAEHLGHLFQDLLDVSKADDGRLSNNPEVVDIVAFVQTIIQGLEKKAADKGLTINYKAIPQDSRLRHLSPIYYVNLDNNHIREIVDNLIENAIKYTKSGEVIVDISGDNDKATISVKDSGIGISAEDLPHLFQKFYRIDNQDTREIGGTGLGLYICRRLAEIMGGRIWAESVRNKGSTFFVELPRISNKEASRLMEQEAMKAKKEAEIAARQQYDQKMAAQAAEQTAKAQQQALHAVPRSGSLTPEQIAAYVTKQRTLAQQSPAPAAQPVAMPAAPSVTAPRPPIPTVITQKPATTQVPVTAPPAQTQVIQPPIRPAQPVSIPVRGPNQ